MLIRRHLHVRGLVQGVYYRDTCRQLAEEAGVTGWVRNLHNGDVEAVFEGSPGNVTRLVRWAAAGPGAAEVTRCTVTAERPEGRRDFRVLPDARPAWRETAGPPGEGEGRPRHRPRWLGGPAQAR